MTSFKGKKGFIRLLLAYSIGILLILSAAYMAESLLSSSNKPSERILLFDAANGTGENSTPPDNSSQANVTDNSFSVSWNAPQNNTWNSSQTMTHQYTPVWASSETADCSLWSNVSGAFALMASNSTPLVNNTLNSIAYNYAADTAWMEAYINCTNSSGTSNFTDNYTIEIDATPPTTPTLLNQSNGATWINLGMGNCIDSGSGVAKKLLYRNTTNIVNLTTEDSYNDTGLSEFTYAYELSCLDNVGNYGSNSTALLANTSKITPPTEVPVPPRNQSATPPIGNAENITYVHPSHLAKGETVRYTPTSETHCIKSACVATLYSVQNFIQDKQGNWKHLGEIASLTYLGNILNISWNKRSILLQPYIIYNGVYTDQLQEYNFSISYTNFVEYIKFKPRIKFVDGLTEFGFKKVSWSNDEVVINFDDLAANNFEVTQNETHISIRNLEGRVSSNEMLELDPTITLNESNAGNVGDSFTNSSDTGVNYGTLWNLSVRSYTSGDVRRIFLLFNLSVIPSSATITDANLSLYMFVAPGNSRTYSAYNTSNSWTETGITQSNQPAADTLQQAQTVTTPASVWKSWNVTPATIASYSQTNQNMSIMIRDNTETATTARFAMFVSKENTTDTSKRPQLNITYVTSPTYSDNSTSSTSANTNVEHRLKWQSTTGLSGYIFSFCNGTYQKTTLTLNPTTTYTFLDNTSNNAYWASPVNPITEPAGGTQATAVQYANMSLNDSSFARVLGDASTNDDPYWSMNFTINETTASINWINVSLGGFKVLTGGSEAATCYVFNWTSATWLSIAVLTTSPTIISSNYTSRISDIVNASTKVLNVYCTGAQFDLNEGIYLDFVSVVVNSTSTTYSTANCSDANAVLTNDSWVAMTGTLDWSNVTKMITSTEGATVKWCVYANGTANEWNSTSCVNPFSYITTAAPPSAAPTYSENSTSSTLAGTNIQHNLRWANGSVGLGLSGYIFSFCNGTWDGVYCNLTTTNVVYGKTDIGTLQDSVNLNFIIAQNVTMPHAVTLTSITFYTTVAGNFSVAIYDGLTPTNLLVNSTFAPCGAAAWCTFSISPTSLASGNYWLAVETDNNGNTFKYVDNASDTNYYVAQTYGTWPSTYGSGTAQQRTYSFYANGAYNTSTSLVNDSWVAFTSGMCSSPYTDCWSNVTKLVNSTVGANVSWCVYANDTNNNWNGTSCVIPFTYTTTEVQRTISFTNPQTNNSNAKPNDLVNFSINVTTDDASLSGYIFSQNFSNPGTWTNSSWVAITGSVTTAIIWNASYTTTSPNVYGWMFYANSSSGIMNASSVQQFNFSTILLLTNWTTGSLVNSTSCTSGSPCQYQQYQTFIVNGSITCKSYPAGLSCGSVTGGIRYNDSGATPDTLISNSSSATPFYLMGGGSSDNRPVENTSWKNSSAIVNFMPNAWDDGYNDTSTTTSFLTGTTTGATYKVNYTYDLGTANPSTLFVTICDSGLVGLRHDGYLYNFTSSDWVYVSLPTDLEECNTTAILVNTTNGLMNSTGGVVLEFNATCNAVCHTILTSFVHNVADTYLYSSGGGTATNPVSCGNLNDGQTCSLTWTVNVSGAGPQTRTVDINSTSTQGNSNPADNNTDDAYIQITSPAVSLTFTITIPSGGNLTLGDTSTESGTDSWAANYIVAFPLRISVSTPSIITAFSVDFSTSATGNLKFAIYNDTSDDPTSQALIGQTGGYSISAGTGWQTFDLSPSDYITIPTAGNYWIAVLNDYVYYNYKGGTNDYCYYFPQTYASGFTSTFSSTPTKCGGGVTPYGPVSIYVTTNTYPSSLTYPGTQTGTIYFNITLGYQTNVNPCVDAALTNCQNPTTSIFRFWNTGNTAEAWTMNLSALPQTGLTLWGNSSGNVTPFVFGTGAQSWSVNSSIPISGTNWVDAWLFVNASAPSPSVSLSNLTHST